MSEGKEGPSILGHVDQRLLFGPLIAWLAQAGFPSAEFESQGDLLVVKLDPAGRNRFLAGLDLRSRFVIQAKALGFSRVAIDLTLPFV